MKILGFDIGISSIGWAFIENDKLINCGVRIFDKAENPKDGKSLSAPRREARSIRRRLARRKYRLNMIKKLICKEWNLNYFDYIAEDGVLPNVYMAKISPYELRFKALKEKLDNKSFSRVILHIAKHRGYGNKNAKSSNDKDKGKVLKAINENRRKIIDGGYESAGEYLYKEFYQQVDESNKFKKVRNTKDSYTHSISQDLILEELKLIFIRQRKFGVNFSKNFEEQIIDIISFQRPLKEFKVGKCIFYENEDRAPKDSPSAMEFVALTRTINQLQKLTNKTGIIYNKDILQALFEEI